VRPCRDRHPTRSEAGSVIVTGNSIDRVRAAPVARVVDDRRGRLHAAGFLFGDRDAAPTAADRQPRRAEIISHVGARPGRAGGCRGSAPRLALSSLGRGCRGGRKNE
jgi:hypothetical protein